MPDQLSPQQLISELNNLETVLGKFETTLDDKFAPLKAGLDAAEANLGNWQPALMPPYSAKPLMLP